MNVIESNCDIFKLISDHQKSIIDIGNKIFCGNKIDVVESNGDNFDLIIDDQKLIILISEIDFFQIFGFH